MANTPDSRYYEPGPSGGSGWENPRDASSLRPFFNDQTGQWEFRYDDGATVGNSYIRDAVANTERDIFNGPGPGGGGTAGPLSRVGDALKRLGVPLGLAAAGRAFGPDAPALGAGALPPELQELLKLSMDRMRSQEPLFQAVTRQALAGLPDYAKKG